ncbi:MAG: cytochrome P450 [Candidatus Cybelea sp.]
MAAKIPGPGRWETLRGLLPVPFARFPDFLRAATARYGNVVAFALPWRSYVFINEPALIKEILVTQQHAFSKSLGTRVLRLLLGDGLLTSEDPLHRQMRRIVQPAFHRERIAEYAQIMERDATEFVERLATDRQFDAHRAMTELTLRIATETLFGSDESESSSAVAEALRLMMNEFPAMLTPLGALRQRLPLRNTRRFWRARSMLDAIIYGLIARRRRDGSDRSDALSLLLAAFDAEAAPLCHPERSSRSERSRRAGDEQVRDEIMTLFMAGHETTANLLTWTLYLLAQNAEVDERAGAAARDGDRTYLERVLKEVLRLYPPAWIMGREALRDVTLGDGSFIPATTTVFLAPLILHRRAEFFPDPERFDPDRWLGADPPPFSYVPFGGGARRCIGEEFALREAGIVLESLLRRYRFTLAPGARVAVAPLVTLRPAGPVTMLAVRRADS